MALNCMLLSKCLRNMSLMRGKITIVNNYQCSHGIKTWQQNTSRLMYYRKRMLDTVKLKRSHRSEFQDWNYTSELFAFSQRLHESFSEQNLRCAFTHKSYVENEEKKRKDIGLTDVGINLIDNTRLISDGEKIMTPYIKSYLRYFFTRVPEDGIRAIHDYIVSDDVLADVGKWIGCSDLILCKDFPPIPSTIANTVKALIGALRTDHSESHAQKFILDFVLTYIADKDVFEIWDPSNGESILQKIIEKEHLPPAEARLLRESGRGTIESCYVIGFYVNKQLIGSSPGETIAIAKEMAALDSLRRIFNLTSSATSLLFGEKGYNLDLKESKHEHLYLHEWAPSLVKRDKMPLINMITNN